MMAVMTMITTANIIVTKHVDCNSDCNSVLHILAQELVVCGKSSVLPSQLALSNDYAGLSWTLKRL